jgi:hypothetical protein
LFHEFGLLVDGVPCGKEPAEGTYAGVEGEAFWTGFGEGFDGFRIGVAVAEIDDVVLVLG